jgi:Ni,Fe-hydrogenase III small subunit/ferredoxin
MNGWIWHGLRRGILSTRYPQSGASMPNTYRGAVVCLDAHPDAQRLGAEICPTQAISVGMQRARVDRERCIQCGRCADAAPQAFAMNSAFELAHYSGRIDEERLRERLREAAKAFGRSVHIRHVDAGSDGSEEQELQAIFNPFYDANRLGIFLTATPRHADVLVVTGAVTAPMIAPLRATYDAMPEPRIVLALGSTACSGSVFREDERQIGVGAVLPVDVYIPGAPPSPLTILHGLLLALQRASQSGNAS